jgi:iron-sulfur cluster assembly protein
MISVTREALDRFKLMQEQQEDQNMVMKIFVRNVDGAMRYGMAWAEADESDVIVESDGVRLHLEEFSVPFLSGAEIGYIVEDLRQGFSIRNPNMGGCGGGGCGGGCSCGAR